ncbi:MAG: DMT family transporter [Ruthenibacterium sp.]
MTGKQARSNLLLLLTALIWGCAFVAQSAGMDYVGPFTFNSARSFIGAIFLLPCIALIDKMNGRKPSLWGVAATRQQRKMLLLGGVAVGCVLTVASGVQQIGIMDTTVGKAGFITALYIIIVPLLGLFAGRQPGIRVWVGVGLAVFGMYLLCMTQGLSIGKGDFYVFLSAVGFALHILIIDYFSGRVDGVRMACMQFFVCGLLSAVPALLFERPSVAALFSAWAPLLYAGVLSCGVGYTLQIVAQKHTEPTIASLLMSLESVFAVLAGWVVLHETLTLREGLGCALVFAAIILAQLPQHKKISVGAADGVCGEEPKMP